MLAGGCFRWLGLALVGLLAASAQVRAGPGANDSDRTPLAAAESEPGAAEELSMAELKAALAELRRRLATGQVTDLAPSVDAARKQIELLTRSLGELRRERDGLRGQLVAARAQQAQMQRQLEERDQRLARATGAMTDLQQQLVVANERQTQLEQQVARLTTPPAPNQEPLALPEAWSANLDGSVFAPGRATLKPEAVEKLADVAARIAANPRSRVRIVGHTDASGDAQTNLELSVRRAEAVQAELIAGFRLDPAQLVALGMGEAEPVASNETVEGRRANRRVEISVEPQAGEAAQP